MSGEIGDILSVDFHWLLNTLHGADYFRRWHSQKSSSGGLMVHKATHHFDLVNWWLGGVPVQVFATGKREFYSPAMAQRLGLSSHHERCRTCPEKERCTFFFDLADNANLKALYLDQEHHDRYYRDQCVFRPRRHFPDRAGARQICACVQPVRRRVLDCGGHRSQPLLPDRATGEDRGSRHRPARAQLRAHANTSGCRAHAAGNHDVPDNLR